MTKRFKVVLEYDGTEFFGWQIQKNHRTVQGVLEEILSKRFEKHVAIVGAGRTDRGVHARGQTAHFDVDRATDEETILKSMNSMLPDDISICSLDPVSDDFHARFSAVSRSYRYRISLTPSALQRRFSWEILTTLNTGHMKAALDKVVGEHDFKPLAKLNSEITNDDGYVCIVHEAGLEKIGDSIIIGLRANRFLRGMVRAITGTVVDVGRGAKKPDCIDSILSGSERKLVSPHAPANGLFLEHVEY